MAEAVASWLDSLDGLAIRDHRNGTYPRHLMSEFGDIELSVPRIRYFCPTEVLKSYARRAPKIDRVMLAGFVLGLITREVGETLLPLFGCPISPAIVSGSPRPWMPQWPPSAAGLRRKSTRRSCSTAWCWLARPGPPRSGDRPGGARHQARCKKEIIDFRPAASESAAESERILTDLRRRGLDGFDDRILSLYAFGMTVH